jgi:hypothetical protein
MKDGTRIAWMRDANTGQLLELFQLSPRSRLYRPFRPTHGTNHALIFGIPDFAGLLPRLLRSGAVFTQDFQQGQVRFLFLRDPDGTRLELLSWSATARRGRGLAPVLDLAAHQGTPRRPRRTRDRAPELHSARGKAPVREN